MYAYAVLAAVSSSYPPHRGRLLMYYSPVRHSMPKHCVRLACIRHAASVHPEPGSNSPLSFSIFRQFHVFLTLSFFFYLQTISCLLDSFFFPIFIDVFTVQFSMSLCPLVECSSIIPSIPYLCKSFFYFFSFFLFIVRQRKYYKFNFPFYNQQKMIFYSFKFFITTIKI